MSLYKRGKVWWCQFTVRGERYRQSTEHTNKELAKDVESALRLGAMQEHGLAPRKVPTLREFIPIFEKWVEQSGKSADTQRDYKNGCRILKASALGGMRLDRINNDEVQAAQLPGANGYKNHTIRTLRRLLSYAVGKRVVASAPRLALYREFGRERIVEADEEKKVAIHASKLVRDAAMVMYDCGLRRKEVAKLRIEYVDFRTSVIRIPDGKSKNAHRVVPMSKRVENALFIRAGDQTEGWMFKGRKKNSHVTPDALTRGFRRAADDAGLSRELVLYSNRHAFGTFVYDATGNLAVVMKSMGHGSMAIAQRYQHPAHVDRVREAIDGRNRVTISGTLDKTAGREISIKPA